MFVGAVDKPQWIKAMSRGSGMMEGNDYVGIPISGVACTPGAPTEDVGFIVAIKPDGALAIVRGIADLIEGPPPPQIILPGGN